MAITASAMASRVSQTFRFAFRDAVSAAGDYRAAPQLTAPATAEAILRAVDEVKARMARWTTIGGMIFPDGTTIDEYLDRLESGRA